MDLTYLPLLFIGILATFIGTIAGSGGMINLPIMLLLGLPIHSAIGANKFSNTLSSFSSFYLLLKRKNMKWKEACKIAPFSLIGGGIGGITASHIPAHVLLYIALLLLIFAFLLSFRKKPSSSNSTSTIKPHTYPSLVGIGAYDGLFGPGQGTMLMFLFLNQGMAHLRAIAFSRFNTFLSCFGAFISYAYMGHMLWDAAILLALGSITGAQLGVRVAEKLPKEKILLFVRAITIVLIIQLGSQFL